MTKFNELLTQAAKVVWGNNLIVGDVQYSFFNNVIYLAKNYKVFSIFSDQTKLIPYNEAPIDNANYIDSIMFFANIMAAFARKNNIEYEKYDINYLIGYHRPLIHVVYGTVYSLENDIDYGDNKLQKCLSKTGLDLLSRFISTIGLPTIILPILTAAKCFNEEYNNNYYSKDYISKTIQVVSDGISLFNSTELFKITGNLIKFVLSNNELVKQILSQDQEIIEIDFKESDSLLVDWDE